MAAELTWTVIEPSDSHSESSLELILHRGEESWEWLKQVILGEFDEDRELSAILADMTISIVPGVIIITSARDMIAIIARLSLHPERRKEVMEWVLLFGTVVPVAYPLIAAGLGVAADGVGAVVTGGAALETDGILGGIVRSICLLLLRGAEKGEKLLAEIIKFLQAHVAGNIYEFLKTVRFSDYIKPICDVVEKVIEQLLALARKASDSLWRYHPTYMILDYFEDITAKLKTFERQYYELQTQLPTKLSEAATWLQQKLDEILRIDPPASGPMLATAGGDIGELGALAAAEGRLLPAWPTNPLGVPPEVAVTSRIAEGTTHASNAVVRGENVHADESHSSSSVREAKIAPIDFEGHIFTAEIKPDGRVVGGHAIISDDIRIIPGTETPPNAFGVYKAKIEVADPNNPGKFLPKTNGGGRSTMFPKSWSADRIKEEVSYAYFNRVPAQKPGMWEGITPSGVLVTGYLKPNVTAYPLMR